MRPSRLTWTVPLAALALLLTVGPAAGDGLGGFSSYVPRVPVSAFGLARDWIDPSRLHVSSLVSVGASSGFGGGTSALQVTTLSYRFRAPLAMSLSIGNAWGTSGLRPGGSSMFLEGFRLAYQPSSSLLFQIQYQDLRSPLQYSSLDCRGPGRLGF